MEGTSAAGPTTGLEGTNMAGPSSRGEGTSVACAGACSVEVGVGRPSSRVGEETDSALEDIPGTGGEEAILLRLLLLILHQGPQDILGDFAEDWLETVDKDEIKSISLFYVITLCMHFLLLKLKLQSMLHP